MSFIKKIRTIERVDALIRRKATGSPRELATKLELSESSVYNVINLIREMGGPVQFNPHCNSYYYEYEVELNIGFLPKENNLNRINGGEEKNIGFLSLTPKFLEWQYLSLLHNHDYRDILRTL